MGCCHSRNTIPTDLKSLLQTYEEGLGWSGYSALKVALELEAEGQSDLKQGQLKRFLTTMRVQIPDFHDKTHPLTSLYNTMCTKGRYSRRLLSLLGLLLGYGSVDRKCAVIEKFYTETDGVIDIKTCFENVCDLALTYLPLYVYCELLYVQKGDQCEKLEKYIEKLRGMRDSIVEFLVNKLNLRGKVTISGEKLKVKMQDETLQSVFSTQKLRDLAVSLPKGVNKMSVLAVQITPYSSPSVSPRHGGRGRVGSGSR